MKPGLSYDPALVVVRQAAANDCERIQVFYAAFTRKQIKLDERWVIAEYQRQIVGAVRLCREEGYVILRTMQLQPAFQGCGIGTRMLDMLELLMLDEPCYCLPYTHLPGFYARIGFHVIPSAAAPPHLQERYMQATAQGKRMLVMKRPAGSISRP